MPLLLLAIPAVAGGWWFFNNQLEKTEGLLIKGAVAAVVVYVAWENRAAIARMVRK